MFRLEFIQNQKHNKKGRGVRRKIRLFPKARRVITVGFSRSFDAELINIPEPGEHGFVVFQDFLGQ